jgi:4a-hydroxytetrahydrobiopterin dehydratase
MSQERTIPATPQQIEQMHKQVPDWKVEKSTLIREFNFKDFYQTMAFVNAVAWIANQQDHHPDLAVSYNKCVVSYSTHSAGGLTEKDFEAAATVDALQS